MTNAAVQKAVSAYFLTFLFCCSFQFSWICCEIYSHYLWHLSFPSQAAALKGSDHRRATNVTARLDAQQKKLNLPILPTTTIGSFPQTVELRRVRREYKANKYEMRRADVLACCFEYVPYFIDPNLVFFRISEEEYVDAIKEEIRKVVELQEELDIDVLVHGEPEVCSNLHITT